MMLITKKLFKLDIHPKLGTVFTDSILSFTNPDAPIQCLCGVVSAVVTLPAHVIVCLVVNPDQSVS